MREHKWSKKTLAELLEEVRCMELPGAKNTRPLARHIRAALGEIERLQCSAKGWEADALREHRNANALRSEVERLRVAVGLATTAVPTMEMDPDHPVEMMQRVVAEVERLRAQNEECVEVSTQLHAIIERLEAEKARAALAGEGK